MSSVVDNNSGGDQPHDDHPSPGDNNSGSGGGGDKDRKDNNNNNDRKNNNWWPVTSTTATGGGESVAAATTTSTSSDGRGGGGGGGGHNIINNNNPPSSEECAEALQYREDLEQATRNSIQENVGAYSVVPGSVPSRREAGDMNVISSTTGGSTAPRQEATDSSMNINAVNLPPNIDIIAEATLVVQDEEDGDYDVEAQEDGDDYDEGEEDGEEGDDADTLGLSPNMTPALGGAMDNDGVSVVSAMTNPTVLESGTVVSSPIRGDIVVPRRRSIDSSLMPLVSSTPDSGCAVPDASVSVIRAHCENSVVHGSAAAAAPDNLGTVYEAEIIEDGPLHVLRSKSGKVMCSVSIAIILILSLGLAFGLRMNSSTTTDGSSSSPIIVDEDLDEVLNYSGGNFCNSGAPQLFFDQYPSYCTKEEITLGGTIQQAVAIAQRRPHPYCVEVEDGVKTSESLYGWHVCSVTNVSPQISLLNGGAVRGEIPDNTPITREMVRYILPFTADTITFIQLKGSDVVKVLENALAYVTGESPLNPYLQAGYPYASGLKFDVDLTADTKVSNVKVSNNNLPGYDMERFSNPIDFNQTYWVVTNQWIANNGDGYLTDVTPLQVVPTELGYTQELERFLTDLSPEKWIPPIMDEMSTMSFNATGLPVASMTDVEPEPVTPP